NSLYSVVNWTGIALGILTPPGPNWLGQSYYAMAAVITVNIWRGLPFFAITILAGLVAIPKDLYEAAQSDGAGPWARFWYVTLPMLKPVLAVVVLFSTIFTFSDFNIVYVLTHRRGAMGPLLVRHAADAQARPGGGRPVLDDLHVQRLQHRVRAHARRADQLHPPVRDLLADDRSGERAHRRGRRRLALPVPAADVRGVGAAALRPQAGLLMSRRQLGTKALMHVLLVPFLVFALFPFYHMTLTSLKQDRELYDRHAVPLVIKQGPTLDHYTKLLWETEFLTWTKNSLLVTVLATTASVIIGTVAAYALSR